MRYGYVLPLIVVFGFCPAKYVNARYTLTIFDDLPGGVDRSSAGYINESGQVVGIANTSAGPRTFLWSPSEPNGADGTMVELGDLPGGNGNVTPYGINSSGQVTGQSAASFGQERTYLWTPNVPNGSTGTMVNIGTLPGQNSARPGAINDYGQVAGVSKADLGHAFLWTPSTAGGSTGSMVDLGLLPGGTWYSFALGMNNRGQVVGSSTTAASSHPFVWSPDSPNGTTGQMHDLELLPDMNFGLAYDINEMGQAVGYMGDGGTEFRAFLWQPAAPNGSIGSLFDLGTLANTGNVPIPSAINSQGVVVGEIASSLASTEPGTAFVWIPDTPNGTSGAMHRLIDLVDAETASGWTFGGAVDINKYGQIAAFGMYDADGPGGAAPVPRGLLLTPNVPEPSAVCLLYLWLSIQMRFARIPQRSDRSL